MEYTDVGIVQSGEGIEYTVIEVPDKNDSISRIVLGGTQYQIRFTWNDTGGYWSFGLLDAHGTPILLGIKIVPRFPLNLFVGSTRMPDGVFGVFTELDTVGRYDFVDGKADFAFIPIT